MLFSNIYCSFLDSKIPNFLEIQRKSFQTFLNTGLVTEFEKVTKISNSNNTIELLFYPKKYKCVPPKWSPKQTILKRKTYACALFVPVQLTNYKKNQIILKWFLLVNLPLMTKNGHFIINGSPKIIMNQIVRSPGVYFQKTIKRDKQINYSADFIAQRGTWLRLESDTKKNEIWAKLKKTPKLPFFLFLRCFGLSIPILNQYFVLNSFLVNNPNLSQLKLSDVDQKKLTHKNQNQLTVFESQDQNLIDLYSKLDFKIEQRVVDKKKISKQFLYKKFLNPRVYNLSRLGRARINQKLGLTIALDHTILTAKDILFACFYLIQCQQGLQPLTDIDDLKNRKIRPVGELIQNQFSIGLFRFEKTILEKLKPTTKKKRHGHRKKMAYSASMVRLESMN